MKVLFLPETVLKLKNLTSHTQYLVSISAFNAAGDGPQSDPRQGRTHQAGRSAMCFLPPGFHWAPFCPQTYSCPQAQLKQRASLSVRTALCSA